MHLCCFSATLPFDFGPHMNPTNSDTPCNNANNNYLWCQM